MEYALFGDVHSSKEDLERVLADILAKAPEALKVGTGDLFECTISKKKCAGRTFETLEEVMLIPKNFTELLTFISVIGNQEERILSITQTNDPLREKLSIMPETFSIGTAEIIHGHQWKWGGTPWSLQQADVCKSPVFYGHSHRSGLSRDGISEEITFGVPYDTSGTQVLVNVGAVVGDCEWVIYNLEDESVKFMKA
jgi:predicted phosphodiesterase